MDAVQHVSACFQDVWVSSGKGLFRNPRPGWLGGAAGETNSGKKGLFPAEKQTFPSPGKRWVSGSETKVLSRKSLCSGRKQTCQRPARKTKVLKLQLQVSDTRVFRGQVRSKFVSAAMAKHCFTCRQKCKTTTAVSFSRHALLWYVCQGCAIPFHIGKSFATCRSSGWSYHFEQNPLQNEVGGWGVEYSTTWPPNRAEGIPFRNRLCCCSGRLVANSCGRLVSFFWVLQVRDPANAIWN